ncbi:MAG: ATPase [Thermovenabulum sp.]|uniref:ATPase n=1 Tax=Thermovenabulum sp. TaxID=3100335 RepID=UPI003C7B0C21
MDTYYYIEQIQKMVSEASKLPFSNKIVLDQDKILQLIDDLIKSLPEEIKKSKKILEERQNILLEAQREGEMIIKEAKEYIEKMVDQNEITKLAKEKSEEILSLAKKTAREIRVGANKYADEVLEELENQLHKILQSVRKGREELNSKL